VHQKEIERFKKRGGKMSDYEQFKLLFLVENMTSGVTGERNFWQEQTKRFQSCAYQKKSNCQVTA